MQLRLKERISGRDECSYFARTTDTRSRALCTILGRLAQDEYVDKYGDKKESVNVVAQRLTIHEWLRKNRPLSELEHDFDEELVPREITKSLFKQIDVADEDIPVGLLGRSIDDLV